MMSVLTMGSLFDGIGGFPLAAVRCGVKPLTRRRFPQMEHVGDITKLDGAKLPPVDIICGGSPCQDSVLREPGPVWLALVPYCLRNKSA